MPASASAQNQQTTIAESLRAAWIGKLNMGGVEPVMQFRIMDIATGEPAVYFDSITEGRSGFRGTWRRKDTTLTFEIPPIQLTFTGTVNETGDVAQGTWRQGGREIPLTLEKSATEYRKVWANRPQRPQPPFPCTRDLLSARRRSATSLPGPRAS